MVIRRFSSTLHGTLNGLRRVGEKKHRLTLASWAATNLRCIQVSTEYNTNTTFKSYFTLIRVLIVKPLHCAVAHACCGAAFSPFSSAPSCVPFVADELSSGTMEAVDPADLFRRSALAFFDASRAARVSIAMR